MKVIKDGNMPAHAPVIATIVWWLFLDRLNAPGWVYGVLGTLMGIVWIICIFRLFNDESVDIFKKKPIDGDHG